MHDQSGMSSFSTTCELLYIENKQSMLVLGNIFRGSVVHIVDRQKLERSFLPLIFVGNEESIFPNSWCANLCVTPSLYYNFASG